MEPNQSNYQQYVDSAATYQLGPIIRPHYSTSYWDYPPPAPMPYQAYHCGGGSQGASSTSTARRARSKKDVCVIADSPTVSRTTKRLISLAMAKMNTICSHSSVTLPTAHFISCVSSWNSATPYSHTNSIPMLPFLQPCSLHNHTADLINCHGLRNPEKMTGICPHQSQIHLISNCKWSLKKKNEEPGSISYSYVAPREHSFVWVLRDTPPINCPWRSQLVSPAHSCYGATLLNQAMLFRHVNAIDVIPLGDYTLSIKNTFKTNDWAFKNGFRT